MSKILDYIGQQLFAYLDQRPYLTTPHHTLGFLPFFGEIPKLCLRPC